MALCGCGKEVIMFGAATIMMIKPPPSSGYGPCGYGYGYDSMIRQRQHRHHHNRACFSTAVSTPNIKRRKSARSFHPVQTITAVAVSAVSSVAVILVLMVVQAGPADALVSQDAGTLSNVPQTLSSDCISSDCKKARIQRPKSRKAETCTVKCVTTCIRGGLGSPGEGPLNLRRPLVVFKQGFRSRQYCLTECSDICNLIGDGDDGP